MDFEYIKKIQTWVEYDNKLIKNKEQIQGVVEKKKELEEDILKYVEENKYDKLTLNISDGNIKFSKRNVTQPLSMKTLKTILEKYVDEKSSSVKVNEILEFVSTNLETKQKVHMQRDFKEAKKT